jgi:hypothetical protein
MKTKDNSSRSSKTKKTQHHSLSMSSSYRHKPAELYRTDFITAMKLPDTEMLDEESYWVIRDQWKLDWEKGVQVPVKPEALNRPNFCYFPDQYKTSYNNYDETPTSPNNKIITMPKKYLCPANDKNFKPNIHDAYLTHNLINENINNQLVSRYDCDDMDMNWLNRVNLELEMAGIEKITRVSMELLFENFEIQTNQNLKTTIDKFQSYSIEYDEGIVCDVCHSPDSEDTNEMVFCDGCNMCVHQACYGIEKIPRGNWLCSPCAFGGSSFKPECVLCPNIGGALKATKNYRNWAHVSCALWIPETGFANPNKMEPIVNLNQIMPSRWQLVCNICKEKRGCCLQCSEKRCHAAFHVTCAFKNNLEMQTILSEDNDDIIFRAYCGTHTKKRQLQKQQNDEDEDEEAGDIGEDAESQNSDDVYLKTKEDKENLIENNNQNSKISSNNKQDEFKFINNNSNYLSIYDNQSKFFHSLATMTEAERKFEIFKQINLLNYQFYKQTSLDVAREQTNRSFKHPIHIELVYNYWKLKRRFNKMSITASNDKVIPVENKPLMFPKIEDCLTSQSERFIASRIRVFVKLRQDLEKVRNLCYMVTKREKLKLQFIEINQQLLKKQVDYLAKYSINPTAQSSSTPSSSSMSTSSTMRSGRLREILQVKNADCIYDNPEFWLSAPSTTLNEESSLNEESFQQEVKDNQPLKNEEEQPKNKITSKIINKNQNRLITRIKNKYDLIKKNKNSNKPANGLINMINNSGSDSSGYNLVKKRPVESSSIENLNDHDLNNSSSSSSGASNRQKSIQYSPNSSTKRNNSILKEKINKLINNDDNQNNKKSSNSKKFNGSSSSNSSNSSKQPTLRLRMSQRQARKQSKHDDFVSSSSSSFSTTSTSKTTLNDQIDFNKRSNTNNKLKLTSSNSKNKRK